MVVMMIQINAERNLYSISTLISTRVDGSQNVNINNWKLTDRTLIQEIRQQKRHLQKVISTDIDTIFAMVKATVEYLLVIQALDGRRRFFLEALEARVLEVQLA